MTSRQTIIHGDSREVLPTLEPSSFDACVTDSPYGMRFMGQQWDYDVPDVELWRAVLRVLKPGGHLITFGGRRTYHRLACRVEDAGFEVRDMMTWVFGGGFPKTEYEMKPAHEPILVARKPFPGLLSVHIEQQGLGALSIGPNRTPAGRVPANFILGCACEGDVHEAYCAVAQLDRQSGHLVSGGDPGKPFRRRSDKHRNVYNTFKGFELEKGRTYSDAGGASRFFYVARVSRAERGPDNRHPTVKPVSLMRHLVRLATPFSRCRVLDPFAGTGSTALACFFEGRAGVSVEREAEHVVTARRRLARAQGELFAEAPAREAQCSQGEQAP